MNTPTILSRILESKAREVEYSKQHAPVEYLEELLASAPQCRGFLTALRQRHSNMRAGVIAEIKKASPSKGVIRADFNPGRIASDYASCGATCLSVLTDTPFFQGSPDYLRQARSNCSLPVLRKDFIVDDYQILESRAMGADCILLIVSALGETQMRDLYQQAISYELDVLIEVHNQAELAMAARLNASMIGVNNRNLHTFETDLTNTIRLLPNIPDGTLIVTESGIHTRADIDLMMDAGVTTFLVGEAFMKAESPGAKLSELFGHQL